MEIETEMHGTIISHSSIKQEINSTTSSQDNSLIEATTITNKVVTTAKDLKTKWDKNLIKYKIIKQ